MSCLLALYVKTYHDRASSKIDLTRLTQVAMLIPILDQYNWFSCNYDLPGWKLDRYGVNSRVNKLKVIIYIRL